MGGNVREARGQLTLKLLGPAAGVSGSLTVAVAYNPYGRGWGK